MTDNLDKRLAKKFGNITGSVIAGAKKLPKKTAEASSSIKNEFVSGYKSSVNK